MATPKNKPQRTELDTIDIVETGLAELPLPVQDVDDAYRELVTGFLEGWQDIEDDLYDRVKALDWQQATSDDLLRLMKLFGVWTDLPTTDDQRRLAIAMLATARAGKGTRQAVYETYQHLVDAGLVESFQVVSWGTATVRVELTVKNGAMLDDWALELVSKSAVLVAPAGVSINVVEVQETASFHFGDSYDGVVTYGRMDDYER